MSKRKLAMTIGFKGLPKTRRTLLVDGDIICYQAVTDPQAYRAESNEDDEWTFTLDAAAAKDAIVDRLAVMATSLRAEKVVIAFGSPRGDNWRRKVLREYKANRSLLKPLGYGAMRAWMEAQWPSVSAPLLEADDVLGLIQTGARAGWSCTGARNEGDDLAVGPYFKGRETIIVSEDKDMATVPGLWYNPRVGEVVKVTPDQAKVAHLTQALTGDKTDNYKGCPGVGAVGAAKVLAVKNPRARWAATVAAFKKAGLDEDEALVQARVARILQKGDYDPTTGELTLWHPS